MTVKDDIQAQVALIAATVRVNRKAAHLTQQAVAELAGVGKTAVFDLEKGKPTVQLDTVLKIFRVLGIKLQFTAPAEPDDD